jgi:hypothetical protein
VWRALRALARTALELITLPLWAAYVLHAQQSFDNKEAMP